MDSSTDTGSPHSVHTTLPNKDFRQLSKAITFGSVVMCRDVSEVVDWLESWDSSLGTYDSSLSGWSGLGGGEGVGSLEISWSL